MIERDILVVIPARGGSKGVPKKNIKSLLGKPLIEYSLDFVIKFFSKEDICVSTDSQQIKALVENLNFNVPFLRPKELATDFAGTREVLLHAYNYYKSRNINYKFILLIQPTTPVRDNKVIEEIIKMTKSQKKFDLIVSVKESKSNPYFNLYEEDENGFLNKSKKSKFLRRQDCPKVYEFNGAFYLILVDSLLKTEIGDFERIIKIINNEAIFNIDIDTLEDWEDAEILIEKTLNK
jgi:CMP-N,N'-diacetyllegionaminic acid synthase